MGIKLHSNSVDLSVKDRAILNLYGRWLATCYSYHLMKTSEGHWWLETLDHFTNEVLPTYEKNGYLDSAIKYVESYDNNELHNYCTEYGTEIEFDKLLCRKCETASLPF